MNSVHEETNRTGYISALARREKIRWKWIYLVWPAIVILAFCAHGIYIYLGYGVNEETVSINGQGLSTEQMIRKDFEKWSEERVAMFEKSLQNLQMRADMVQGELRPEAQQRIERLKTMQASAQAELSKLQNCDAAFWGVARRDMTKILRDLKKAHSLVSAQLTGLMF